MASFKANCPNCGTRSVMFQLMENSAAFFDGSDHDVFARCNHCTRGIVASYLGCLDHSGKVADLDGCDPDKIFPSSADTGAPPQTPEKATEFYRQGMENLPGNPDAAGAMFRKTLEVVLKEKFPDLVKMNLASSLKMPPTLAT